MSELFVILVGTALVNNFVLVRFLGLCPFLGVSRNLESAAGMSLATAVVLTLSSAAAYLLQEYVLAPLERAASTGVRIYPTDQDGHPTEVGHAVIANALLPTVRRLLD